MRVVTIVARVLLGLMFTVFGANGFLFFIPAPPIPGLAGEFMRVVFTSHYLWLISGVQLIAGVLLLIDRYVPIALIMLAAMLVNIWTFHITISQSGYGMPIVPTVLWLIVAVSERRAFAPLLAAKTQPA
jgi:putative oxidoreductase